MTPATIVRRATTALGIGLAASAAMAQQGTVANPTLDPSAWRYELALYLWGTEVSGSVDGTDFELGFDQIVENLNFALMGGLKAYKGPWMTYGELTYASVRQDGSASHTVQTGLPDVSFKVDAVVDSDFQTTVVNFGGGYRLVERPNTMLYGTFGVRYLSLDSDLTLDVTVGQFGRSYKTEWDEDYWDAVVGIAGRTAFNDRWFLQYLADIGTGQSEMTWQAGLGIGYNLGRSDIVLGYRQMEWDLPDDDLIDEYTMAGPILLWNYRF